MIKACNILIDKRKKLSVTEQVTESICMLMQRSTFKQSAVLPSPEELSRFYSVDFLEIESAYALLMNKGVVTKNASKYILFNTSITADFVSSMNSIYNNIINRSKKASIMVIKSGVIKNKVLRFNDERSCSFKNALYIKKVYFDDDSPMSIIDHYINLDILDKDLMIDINLPIYHQLPRYGITLAKANKYFKATRLNTEQSKLLNVPKNSASMMSVGETYDMHGRLVDFYIYYSSSHYQIISKENPEL